MSRVRGNGCNAESDFRQVALLTPATAAWSAADPPSSEAGMTPAIAYLLDGRRMTTPLPMPRTKILGVLVGFPLGSWAVSLVFANQTAVSWTGLDFTTVMWVITFWYALQVGILARVLRSAGWSWRDLGYGVGPKGAALLVLGYLVVALGVLGFIEYTLASAGVSQQQLALSDFGDLTPKTTGQRLVFVLLGLMAGLCEELVYRGFAINALASRGMNRWLAMLAATVPFVLQHGLVSLERPWWYASWGVLLGVLFVATKRLYVGLVTHWLVILAAMAAILQAVQ
jgi:membrane protease YdiL (CAAX protease family)